MFLIISVYQLTSVAVYLLQNDVSCKLEGCEENDASGKNDDYGLEEMTFAVEEEVLQPPDIPVLSTLLEENNALTEKQNKEPEKLEKRQQKKRKSTEKPAEKKVHFSSYFQGSY